MVDNSSQGALTLVSPTHRPSKRVKVESSPRYAERTGRYVTKPSLIHGSCSFSWGGGGGGGGGGGVGEHSSSPPLG